MQRTLLFCCNKVNFDIIATVLFTSGFIDIGSKVVFIFFLCVDFFYTPVLIVFFTKLFKFVKILNIAYNSRIVYLFLNNVLYMKRYLLAILFVLSTVVTVSAQESKVYYPWQETRKGLDVKFFGAYSYGLGVNTGYNMMQAEIGLGKQFEKMHFGLSSGMWSLVNVAADPIIPIILEYQVGVTNRRLSPNIAIRTGFGINTAEDIKMKKETIKQPNYMLMQGFIGCTFSLLRRMDLDCYGGYTLMSAKGQSSGFLTVAASIRFHRTTKPKNRD